MSDFFYPDRRSIYFTSLNDLDNPFHYLVNYYKISSQGLIRENDLTKSPAFNKYMHALQILKNGIAREQSVEQAYFTNLLQDNKFKAKKFNSLRNQLQKIMCPKKGQPINYIDLVNLINRILLGDSQYKAVLALEDKRLTELSNGLKDLEAALKEKGELIAKRKKIMKNDEVLVKAHKTHITSKEQLYDFLYDEYLEKHQFQAFRKYFSKVHQTVDNLVSKVVNEIIETVLTNEKLINKLTVQYNNSQDVYSGDLMTFIINNILLQLSQNDRIPAIIHNALNDNNQDTLITEVVQGMEKKFETFMVGGQSSTFGRTKNGQNAVKQEKVNKKINKLKMTGSSLADDIIDMLEKKEITTDNDYFDLLSRDDEGNPTSKLGQAVKKLQEQLKELDEMQNAEDFNEDNIATQQNIISRTKNSVSQMGRNLIQKKIETLEESLQQEFLQKVKDTLSTFKIYISGPTYSEIIDGIRNYFSSNDWYIHSGPVNLKADSIRFRPDNVQLKSRMDNSTLSNLSDISSEILHAGAQTFYNTFSENLPQSGSSTNYAQGKTAFYTGIRESMKEIKTLQDQKMKDDKESAAALRELALSMKDNIIVTETDKTFNTYFNDIGFVNGSLGGNLTTQLQNFQELFNAAGVGMTNTEVEWLEIAIVNCARRALGAERKDPIEHYLSTLAGFAVFDEGSAELELIADKAPQDIIELGSPQLMHLYKLDGLYYPGSFVLERIYEQLESTLSQMQDQVEQKTHDGAHIRATASEIMIQHNGSDLAANWRDTYELAKKEYTSIDVSFLSNLFNIVEQLKQKMKI